MNKTLIKIGFTIGAVAVAAAVLNFGFLWQNLKFTVQKPVVPPAVEQSEEPERFEPDILEVDSIGLKAPVQYVNEVSEKVFQAALQNGVVHYPGTAMPGQAGNAYIFGHSSDYIWAKGGYKTVFALLPKVRIGDKIFITDPQGLKYIYQVIETKVVAPDDMSVLDQGGYKDKILTLQTSYPLGTALKRFVVVAKLKD